VVSLKVQMLKQPEEKCAIFAIKTVLRNANDIIRDEIN